MLLEAQLTQLALAPILTIAACVFLLAAREAPGRRVRGYRRARFQMARVICLMLAYACLSGVFDLATEVERAAHASTPAPENQARTIAYR